MTFKTLVAPSLTDMFVNQIEQMILSGELKIGTKLPPERQMAKEMNVSLAVINAGIARLTDRGFLTVEPRKGVYVEDYIRNGNINTMKAIFEYTGERPDSNLVQPIAEFRRSIEISATRLACEHRSEEALKTMSELTALAASQAYELFPETAFEFHHEIAVASKNIYYPMITQTFKSIYTMFYRFRLSEVDQKTSVKALNDILEAVKAQDADLAEELISKTIDNWLENL